MIRKEDDGKDSGPILDRVGARNILGQNKIHISIDTNASCFWLSCYLIVLFLVADFLHVIIHELGHLVFHVLCGNPIMGFYISFTKGQVFALYSPGSGGLVDLAGFVSSLTVGYVMYMTLKRWRPGGLILPTFLVLLSISLLLEPIYILWSAALGWGDSYQAARAFGISRVWFVGIGMLLLVVNYTWIVKSLIDLWFRLFCCGSSNQQKRKVVNLCILELSFISLLLLLTLL